MDGVFLTFHNIEGADLAHEVDRCTAVSPIQHPKIPENDGSPKSSMCMDCGLSSTFALETCYGGDIAVQLTSVLEVIDELI